jgi:hypothetical protein
MSRMPNKTKRPLVLEGKELRRTTQQAVDLYDSSVEIFGGLISEVRELSKKKPDATLSKGKVRIINRVLTDLRIVMDAEPEKKFLDLLDDEELPQTSDAVLVMVQYESALREFPTRYFRAVKTGVNGYGSAVLENFWITEDFDPKNPSS